MSMPSPPKTASGKFILVATIDCLPGKLDRVQELAKIVRDLAVSEKEPKTHTYRVCVKQDKMVIFEEYQDEEGFKAHIEAEPFKNLVKANEEEKLWSALDISFYEEV